MENKIFLDFEILEAEMNLGMAGYATNPYTNRTAYVAFNPESGMNAIAARNYDQFLATEKDRIITGTQEAQELEEVTEHLIDAAQKWAEAKGNPDFLKNFNWQLALVKEDYRVLTTSMPGGKIIVFSGILPYTQNVDGLAVILSHEISHTILKHLWENFAKAQQKTAALATAQSYTNDRSPISVGLGGYSRVQEAEADTVGLTLMLIAGYTAEEAISFWEKVLTKKIPVTSDFIPVHQVDKIKIENLKNQLPIAEETAKMVSNIKNKDLD